MTVSPTATRYINELNKDQGLGFLVLRKRITFTLVMGLMIQTVSVMVVISTTLMSIATVESEEKQTLEVDAQELMDCLQKHGRDMPGGPGGG